MTEVNFSQYASDFEALNEIADGLSGQNDRFFAVDEIIHDEDFASIARAGIQLEQTATVDEISLLGEDLPYEELGVAMLNTENRLAELVERRDSVLLGEEIQQRLAGIDETLQATLRLSPNSSDKATALAEKKKAEILEEATSRLEDEIEEAENDLAQLRTVWDITDTQWAVPYATYDEKADAEAQRTVVDEIPVEPTIVSRQADEIRELRERHVDAPEASLYISLLLAEEVGRVVTVDQIVKFIYSAGVREGTDDRDLRSRVTTLLGPKIGGEKIRSLLEDEYGLVLQYGKRRRVDIGPDGEKRYSQPQRIYRAVEIEKAKEYSSIVESTDTRDTFEGQILTDVVDVATDEEGTEEPPKIPGTDVIADGVIAVEIDEAESQPKWEREFSNDIDDVIAELEQLGFLKADEPDKVFVSRVVSVRHPSKLMGTDTAVDRLVSAGLMSKSQADGHDTELNSSDLVLMRMFNTHVDILSGGKGRRRKVRAVKLVNKKLEEFFNSNK